MIKAPRRQQPTVGESGATRPVASAEQWLGRNESEKRRLWERLNPRHRKQLRLIARALVMRQFQGRVPEELRARLLAQLDEFERLAGRIEQLLAQLANARRTNDSRR